MLAGDARRDLHVNFHWRPQDLFDSACRPSIELAAELLSCSASIDFVPVLGSGNESTGTAKGLPGRRRRRSGLIAMTAKVTINLVQAAFRSARRRSGRIEDELDEVMDLALKALLERRQFLARLGAGRENPLWDVLGRPQNPDGAPLVSVEEVLSPVGLIGLNECVMFLSGSEFHQGSRAHQRGREIVTFLRRKIEREQRGLGLVVQLEETPVTDAIRRLGRIDRRTFPQYEEIERGRLADGPAREIMTYTGGVRIHPAAPVDPLRRLQHLMSFLPDVVPRGVFEESPELRSAEPGLVVCLLEEAAAGLTRQATRS